MYNILMNTDNPPEGLTSVEETFGKQGVKNIIELAKILKRIHIRLIKEGYTIKDGEIYKAYEGENRNIQ